MSLNHWILNENIVIVIESSIFNLKPRDSEVNLDKHLFGFILICFCVFLNYQRLLHDSHQPGFYDNFFSSKASPILLRASLIFL